MTIHGRKNTSEPNQPKGLTNEVFLVAIISTLSLASQAGSVEGSWVVGSLHCQSGTQISGGAAQLLKNLEMVFDNGTLTQTLALMPTCKVTSVGPYKLAGSELEIGALKVGISQTCPPGFSSKDKGPTTAKISFQQNSFVLVVDPTGTCPAGDRLVMIMKRKAQ